MNKPVILLLICAVILFLPFMTLAGQELGCKAPPLQIAEWIKGGPVDIDKELERLVQAAPAGMGINESLINAVKGGRVSEVRTLLVQGADADAKNEEDVTVLMEATYSGYTEIAGMLIHAGADVIKKDKDGANAEDWARQSGHSDIARLLHEASPENRRASDYSEASPCNTVLTQEEQALYELLMEYRVSLSLSSISLSPSLSCVAKVHVRDLQRNPPSGECNLHSWSEDGPWSACCYTNDHARASCMWDKPKELSDYQGNGYEIASWGSPSVTPEGALKGWIKSSGHNSVIINKGMWRDIQWRAIGIGIYGNYAVVWFGKEIDPCSK